MNMVQSSCLILKIIFGTKLYFLLTQGRDPSSWPFASIVASVFPWALWALKEKARNCKIFIIHFYVFSILYLWLETAFDANLIQTSLDQFGQV